MTKGSGGEGALLKAITAERDRLATEQEAMDKIVAIAEGVGLLQRVGLKDASSDSGAAKPKQRKSRTGSRRRNPTRGSAQEVQERCEAVLRLLRESPEPLAFGAICDALGLPHRKGRTAIERLTEQKLVKRVGTGSGTKYRLRKQADAERREASPEGRFVEIVAERGYASQEEIAQALGLSVERAGEIGGRLVGEEELEMDERNGGPVYVMPRRLS